jgi:hypothetical protein
MAEDKNVTILQQPGSNFAVEHHGAIYGSDCKPPIEVTTAVNKPLVHMVCWDETDVCKVNVAGELKLIGDAKSPIQVRMGHHFDNVHEQHLKVDELDHKLKVETRLDRPIHHALQMRTPLQLRFCNPWHVASDYIIDVKFGQSSVMSVRVTGATIATPQQCEEEPCPPPKASQSPIGLSEPPKALAQSSPIVKVRAL